MVGLLLAGCETEVRFSESLRGAHTAWAADGGLTTPLYLAHAGVVQAIIVGDCVDYPRAAGEPELAGLLRRAVGVLAETRPEALSRDEALRFWINAYNLLVVRALAVALLERPSASIAEEDFALLREPARIGGLLLSAAGIHHGVLRGDWAHPLLRELDLDALKPLHAALWSGETPDPRLHFVLSCGARSCPPLAPPIGSDLEAELDRLTRAFISDFERGATVQGRSALFDWYAADFGDPQAFLDGYALGASTDTLPWDWRPAALDPESPACAPLVDSPEVADAGVGDAGECAEGEIRRCGPPAAIGVCQPGTQTCAAGAWGACEGAVEPGEELCDAQDNDCDGSLDEAPAPPAERPCPSEGVCADAALRCSAGVWICELPDSHEAQELRCDTLDNDCDGAVDEALSPPPDAPACAGPGVCATSEPACEGGAWICVFGADYEAGEERSCDGEDNDCDAATDEGLADCDCLDGLATPCGSDVGACQPGEQTCIGGTWSACSGVQPSEEACDGVDNDCDGAVDDGVANACGGCGPAPREACEGSDEDCDGRVDEGVTNACGACGAVPEEICNAGDDDCDGQIDEGVANACGGCGAAGEETCEGSDEDCDGLIDEGLSPPAGLDCPQLGVCRDAEAACLGPQGFGCSFPGTYEPDERSCDFKDNDCDGRTDEGVLNACDFCGPLPNEDCNHLDDDCDGVEDEGCPIDPNSQPVR